MDCFDKLANRIAALCELCLCCALAVMTLVTVLEVVRRYWLGASYAWAEELIRFLLVWVTFLGGSAAFYRGNLICFDMLTSKVSPRTQHYLLLVTSMLLFAIIGVFFVYSVQYTLSRPIQFQRSPGMGLPMAWVYMAIPAGLGLMLFYNVCTSLRVLRWLRKGGDPV